MMTNIQILNFIRSGIVIIVGVLLFYQAKADALPRCKDAPSPIPIGYKCIEVHRLHARGDDNTDTFRSSYSDSWIILDVESSEFVRYGNTSGPNFRNYTANSRIKSYESWNHYQ